MTIAEYVKEYRQKNALSQREFAKILGVTDMTVSRIEAGQNYISLKVADALSKLMNWEDFGLLNQRDPQVAKIKRVFFEKHPEYIVENAMEAAHNWREDFCEAVDASLKINNFTFVGSPQKVAFPCDRLYFNGETQKYWAFFFSFAINQNAAYTSTYSQFLSALGYTQIISETHIHKISLVTSLMTNHHFYEDVELHKPYNLACDFSIFPHSSADRLHTEIDLSLLGDGRGLFDMDSPDADIRAREIERFSKWKRSLL